MSNGTIVLTEQNNNRHTLYAVVEQDERTAYFYLYPAELQSKKYRMRACWLRNLQPAPLQRDKAAMENGDAPMLEAQLCNHPEGKEPLVAERIAIIWMPEEDGAAVLYDGEILGVIPGWSLYIDEPVAYAADCIAAGDSGLVFPLGTPADNIQHEKVIEAIQFAEQWESTDVPQWPVIQEQFITTYEARFGKMQQYFAIDNNEWPPMALGKFEKDDIIYFLTMGVSIRPMPWVSYLYNDSAPAYRRMEIGLAVSKADYTEDEIMKMAEGISAMADIPWRHISWLGEGHTIASSKFPAPFDSIVLSAALYNGEGITLPEMHGDKVNFYWASPVTLAEREFALSKPNGGYELLEKMIGEDITHVVKKRKEIS
jgi:hypothetical protein